MFLLPIPILLLISVAASSIKFVLGGYYSKRISKCSFHTWFFGLFQSLFCIIAIIIIFLVSGGLGKFSFYSLALGALIGAANIFGLVTNMMALAIGPFSYTTVIISLSAIIPSLSGLFFGETVSVTQYIGIGLMIICLVLSPEREASGGRKKTSAKWLVLSLISALFNGVIGIVQKIHQNSVHSSERAAILVGAFALSVILSAVMLAVEKKRERADAVMPQSKAMWIIPGVSGLVFAFPHTVNLYLSGAMDAVIMFPIVNLCPMILSMICGFIIFREKLSRNQWIGVAIGILSTVFVSGMI